YGWALRRGGLGEPLEIQPPADQQALLLHSAMAAPPESPQAVPVLAFSEHLFDELAASLRELIAEAPRPHAHSRMGCSTPARLDGDMWLDVACQHRRDEIFVEEPSVRAERRGRESQSASGPVEPRQTATLLRRHALEDFDPEPEQEPMPILHHGIDRVAGIGARARAAFRHEAAVGVGPRAMRRVAPLLAAEIHRAVARIWRVAVVGSILPPQSALILLWIEHDLDRQELLSRAFARTSVP